MKSPTEISWPGYAHAVDESIKEYLRRIGAKGGKAIVGTPKAKARAAKAAKARWAKAKAEKQKTK
jgi:hypothetical protein